MSITADCASVKCENTLFGAQHAHNDTFDPTLRAFHEFRKRLHRGGTFAYLWTPDTGDYYTDKKTGDLKESKRSLWFPVDKDPTLPARWHQSNVYFGIHPVGVAGKPWQRSVKKANPARKNYSEVTAINCVFAEVDGKDMVQPTAAQIAIELDKLQAKQAQRIAEGVQVNEIKPEKLRTDAISAAKQAAFLTDIDHYNELARQHVETMTPRPSAIIHSGGGWHLYWFLRDTFYILTDDDRERAHILQRRWVGHVGGDDGAKDLARILRPFGTYNVKAKYAPNYPIVTLHNLDYSTEYGIDELEGYLPEVETATYNVIDRGNEDIKASNGDLSSPSTGKREHSNHVYRVMTAYNERNTVVSVLLSFGYTDVGDGRLSRPGEPDSAGVSILGAKSYHHSSNDPLFEACGPHRLSAFDATVHLTYGGDYERAALMIGHDLGIYPPEFIDMVIDQELHFAETADFAKVIPEDRHSAVGYRTGDTDKQLYINLLRTMKERKRIADVRIGLRQLAETTNSDGVPVALCSAQTVKNWIERVSGVLVDAKVETTKSGAKLTTLSLSSQKVNSIFFTVVARLDSIHIHNIGMYKVSKVATTVENIPLHSDAVHEYLGDDAFLRGRARAAREQIANNVKGLCFEHARYAEAHSAYKAAQKHKPADVHEYRAIMGAELFDTYRELKQRAESEFLRSLGTYGLIVLSDIEQNPGTTRKEIADRRGLSIYSVGGVVRKLEEWELIEVDHGFSKSKTYTAVPDVWGEVSERTPEAMTYTIGAQRRDSYLETAQQHAKAQLEIAETEDQQRAARKRLARIENKRFKTLPVVCPDMSEDEIRDWIYNTSAHADYMARESQQQEAPAQVPYEASHDAWVELLELANMREQQFQTGDPSLFTSADHDRMRHLDSRVNGGFFAEVNEVEQAAVEFKKAGKRGRSAYVAAVYAGYSEDDARQIEYLTAQVDPPRAGRIHINSTIAKDVTV